MNSYTLGLDIGSNSIGWALLNIGNKPSVIDIGVRVFPEGVDRDTKGAEKSKNATRREARGSRRIKRRRHLRRAKLIKTLKETGLLPSNNAQINDLLTTEPYALRAKGLNERLELYEFGRVLFHINQRRGFKSNRKTGKANESSKISKEAGELQEKINKANCRTLGEYFAQINPEEDRIRGHYTFRSMYEEEFEKLWEKQQKFYPDIFTNDLRTEIRNEIIFYQRPLKPTEHLIGDCDLELSEKRCSRGDWYARRFRLLQDVNNLKILNPDGSEEKLTFEQREKLLKQLEQKKELTWDEIRKLLGLMKTQIFNLEAGKMSKLKGDVFTAEMRKKSIFGPKKWDVLDKCEKIQLNEWLVEMDDDELVEKLSSEYDLNDEQIDRVLKISLPQGYTRFSRKAIIKLLEFMEQGALTSEAIAVVYPDRDKVEKGEILAKLPLPKDLRNPIVNKALFEVRKVANAIIREYGKPKNIAIEMARDVKGSFKERQEIHFKILDNEKRNDEVRTKLIGDLNIHNPKRDDVIKYKLWEECNRQCPYTGKQIAQHQLFGDNPEFQIEHILPYSRSLDDSYMNKTLCCVIENRLKGNQIPYEFYNKDKEKYDQIKQRIKTLPWPKRQKFLQKEIELDTCISRELNDTRYICKEVIKYLKQLGIYVRGTRGKITAELRHQWGLNNILDLTGADMKNRDDHRHHAIDAAVVAVTNNEHLRRLAESKYSHLEHGFAEPWDGFRAELEEKNNQITVSHRVCRKVSGALHEETSYGPTGLKDEKGQDIFVYRKKLEDLTIPKIGKIVDPVVRRLIERRLIKNSIDLSTNQKIPKEVWEKPLYMKKTKSDKNIPIKKVRIREVFNNMIEIKNKDGEPYRAVAPGRNHHIEIFEYNDKKGELKKGGVVVTMFEAVRRKKDREAVIKRDHGQGKKFVCSLAINEVFMLEMNDGPKLLHRVQKISSNKQIYFRPHTFAGDLQKHKGKSKCPNTLKGYKVTVDPLGRIWRAND